MPLVRCPGPLARVRCVWGKPGAAERCQSPRARGGHGEEAEPSCPSGGVEKFQVSEIKGE